MHANKDSGNEHSIDFEDSDTIEGKTTESISEESSSEEDEVEPNMEPNVDKENSPCHVNMNY
jgi:hypothetical protein